MLRRLADELVDVHARLLALQQDLGPILATAAGRDRVAMDAGQELDAVSQVVDGLAIYVEALEKGGWSLDRLDVDRAAALVKLDGLAARLSGRTPKRSTVQDDGEVDLF